MKRHERLRSLSEMALELGRDSSDEEIRGLAAMVAMIAKELNQSLPEESEK